MKFSLKTLLIGFGVLAVVFAVLYPIERKLAASASEVELNARVGPRAGTQQVNESKRQRLKRSRKLSSVEAQELLRKIIIPRVDFEDVTLEEAVDFLNAEIAKQVSEGHARPGVRIDPDFMEDIKMRRKMTQEEYDKSLEAALGGPSQPIGLAAYRIPEMRLANVPAELLLKSICDVNKSQFIIYRGDYYLMSIWEYGSNPYVEFYVGERFERIHMEEVRLDRLVRETYDIVSRREYYGHKKGLDLEMSEKAREALLSGEVNLPKINIDMEQVTMAELMESICKLPQMHHPVSGLGKIIFDPLGEYEEYVRSVNPFDPFPEANYPFKVPLDEDWRDWLPRPKEVNLKDALGGQ